MATTAYVSMEMQDGKIHEVYVSSDGYLDHTGKILLQHYTDPKVVIELIERGAIMTLASSVDETMFFGDGDPEDADINCESYDSWDEYATANGDISYIMRNDGVWYFKTMEMEYDKSKKKWKKFPPQISRLDEVVESDESESNSDQNDDIDSESSYEDYHIQWLKTEIQFLQEELVKLESKKNNRQQNP